MNDVFKTRAGLFKTHEQELPDGKFSPATEKCSQRYCSYSLLVLTTRVQATDPVFTGRADPPGLLPGLWYSRPTGEWLEAVPMGNGRLGGMVYGGVTTEWS